MIGGHFAGARAGIAVNHGLQFASECSPFLSAFLCNSNSVADGLSEASPLSYETSFLIAGPLAVSSGLMLMQLTRTFHPPGCATAYSMAIGSPVLLNMEWSALIPTTFGATTLVAYGLLNNLCKNRPRYPVYWWEK